MLRFETGREDRDAHADQGRGQRGDADHLRLAAAAAARRPRRVPDAGPEVGINHLRLPAGFPRDVRVVATDLDHTLIWKDRALRPRTLAVLERARATGMHVIVVTGR